MLPPDLVGQVALGLTVSSEFIRSLSDSIDYTTMAKLMGAISVFMGVFDGIISRGRSVSRESLDMFRGLTVLVFVQITLKAVHERASRDMDDTMKDFGYVTSSEHETLSLFSRIPLTAWPLMEGFAISCIAVVVATLMARLSGGSANMSRIPPEVKRLVDAIRFAFADATGKLVSNHETRRVIAIIGAVFLQRIGTHSAPSDEMYRSVHVLVNGLGMAWFNTVVQMVVPDGSWSTSVLLDITCALCLAAILKSMDRIFPGMGSLQGYVEWHLSGVIERACLSEGVSRGEIILVSASLLCTIGVYSWGATTIQTLNSICALVFTNSLLMWVLEHVRTGSSIDGLSIIVIVIVMAKIFVRLESRFLG